MNSNATLKIPYGISDYEAVRAGNYYYVDKTSFLGKIEQAGRYLFFTRPRRFGKTLLLSMMETYYDIAKKDRFDSFFNDTDVFDRPTEEKGSYLILRFNFSVVASGPGALEESFTGHVMEAVELFLAKYKILPDADVEQKTAELKQKKAASDILRSLLELCKQKGQTIFVIIDEYDHFSNTILASRGRSAYESLTHGDGFFRAFFNVIKGGTSGSGAPISRLFITGVSPITMDDVTSGFNIGKNITTEPEFNCLLGFTQPEVLRLIDYYRDAGKVGHRKDVLLPLLEVWYGNYLFSEDTNERLFNSDMVLYFFDNYLGKCKIPKELIDRNVRIDYGKVRHLIVLDTAGREARTNGNFSRLNAIIEEGGILAKLEKGFPLEQVAASENFVSLLYYFGLLTIDRPVKDKLNFTIPNQTVKHLYYDYIKEAYRETGVFSIDLSRYSDLMTEMAYDGKWQPLFEYIARLMKESMSLRDLITGEKSIQAFLNVYLGLSDLYIIHTEREMGQGYADIVMVPFLARYEGIRYCYLLEIKYIKKKKQNAGSDLIEKLKLEAEDQVRGYGSDKKFRKSIEPASLIKLTAIFSGSELLHIGSIE